MLFAQALFIFPKPVFVFINAVNKQRSFSLPENKNGSSSKKPKPNSVWVAIGKPLPGKVLGFLQMQAASVNPKFSSGQRCGAYQTCT